MESWGRAVRVTVGPPDALGRSWTELPVRFQVDRDRSADPNKATITIRNLSRDDRKWCALDRQVVTLDAGFPGQVIPRFRGRITRATSKKESTGWVTELEALDRADLVSDEDEVIALSRAPGITQLQLLQDLLESVGADVHLVAAGAKAARPALQGYTAHGRISDIVREIAEAAEFEVSVQGGIVVIVPRDGASYEPAPLISRDTGLVGRPQQAQIELAHRRRGSRRRERPGVTFDVLLNVPVAPLQRVQLEAVDLKGVFIVHRVRYRGDTHGRDWYAAVEAVAEES